jgi:hypothetical protein
MSKSFIKCPVKKSAHPVRDHPQEWAWVAKHGDAYRGQWVMVRHDKLLAAAPNIRLLLSRVPTEEAADAVVWYLETDEDEKMAVLSVMTSPSSSSITNGQPGSRLLSGIRRPPPRLVMCWG